MPVKDRIYSPASQPVAQLTQNKSYLLQPNLLFEIRDPDHIISTNCPCTELIIAEEIPHSSLSHTVCTLTRARDVFGTYRFFVGVTGVEPVTFRM